MTVLEVLQNAEFNLIDNVRSGQFARIMGTSQLQNAIRQLEENPDANAEYIEEADE